MATPHPTQKTVPRTAAEAPAGRVLRADATQFRRDFNLRSFLFEHSLAGHPLFAPGRLAELGERMLVLGEVGRFVSKSGKDNAAHSRISAMPAQERVAATIEQLREAGAWMKLTGANAVDPEYDTVLQALLRELEELAGVPLREQITWSTLTVFMASPHIVTPYHIDHESNFLFQVSGSKQITLFDAQDRTLLSEGEIEEFYAGDFEAARFRDGQQARGIEYPLAPGKVVHHPPLAPHWVKNGDEVSISVSIGFCLQGFDRRARIYQVNHFLRRLGLHPSPPGRSSVADRVKIAGVGLISKSDPANPEEILYSGVERLRRWSRFVRGASR
jgi:hypothetical protein